MVQFHTPETHGFTSVEVRWRATDQDSIFFLQLSDTPFMDNLELSFIVINDPRAERFQIDRDTRGKDTLFGTAARNVAEEERAMKAGLAPGQVRPGLRLLREFMFLLERFASRLGVSIISGEALFYHNAIQYERNGFGYLEGRKQMEEIDREFLGGEIVRASRWVQPVPQERSGEIGTRTKLGHPGWNSRSPMGLPKNLQARRKIRGSQYFPRAGILRNISYSKKLLTFLRIHILFLH